MKSDTHIHTQFSDGSHTIDEVVTRAKQFGCDVVAITDHADKNLSAATPEYQKAIVSVRRSHPNMVIVAGLEWNVPPYGGDEHATVLVPEGPQEAMTLVGFKSRFDDLGRETHDPAMADEALRWLEKQESPTGTKPLVLLNHPSRKRQQSMDVVSDLRRWKPVSEIVIGLSGAPGHQEMEANGAYSNRIVTVDRWDPVVSEVGGAWDTLLRQGVDLWAARAPSDFHSGRPDKRDDFWPGQFSETWLYVPQRDADGVFAALRSGTFFAAHGHIAREVELLVNAVGLPRAARSGEVIEVSPDSKFKVSLRLKVPSADWTGEGNRIDEVELIIVNPTKTQLIRRPCPSGDGEVDFGELTAPDAGLILRARGRRTVKDNPDLMFYTNPVRILVSAS